MKYVYIVELNYRDYVFDEMQNAAAFLQNAVYHCRDKNTIMNFGIRVEPKLEAKQEGENNG